MKVIKSNKTTLTYDSVEIIIQDNQDNKKFIDIIYEITLRNYPDIQKTYSYFQKKWNGFSNSPKKIYFTEKQDVLKFIYEFIYINNLSWSGEIGAKKYADEIISNLVENECLEKINALYRSFPCAGVLDITSIRINDLQMVLDSPIMNTRMEYNEINNNIDESISSK
jgi:hypothetical protein